ncbi:hypothetical protein Bbelb_432080 [Branchiostoma belcheri]|nr:hypothetical protein Bbelb_432080 [Branchiostoma belcheri]
MCAEENRPDQRHAGFTSLSRTEMARDVSPASPAPHSYGKSALRRAELPRYRSDRCASNLTRCRRNAVSLSEGTSVLRKVSAHAGPAAISDAARSTRGSWGSAGNIVTPLG